jgi:hypothetical protein
MGGKRRHGGLRDIPREQPRNSKNRSRRSGFVGDADIPFTPEKTAFVVSAPLESTDPNPPRILSGNGGSSNED